MKDEPGGYNGFTALYGNADVQPQISPKGSVTDLDGNVIADSHGNPGFPGFSPTASQTLGYVATMLEAGVPVVYFYIADAHDNRGPALSGVSTAAEGTFGPGEAGYVKQLRAYDKAFGQFFARLAADKFTTANTLFVITADENDHFAGGPPSPPNCDGVTTPCTYAKIGEIDVDLSRLMATEFGEGTPFGVHNDDAPTFYINGNPAQLNPITRRFEHEAAALTAFNPITLKADTLTQATADQQEQAFLHMVTADPNRTPSFIMFANPDYFLSATGDTTHCVPVSSCSQEGAGFAWNHGDFQPEITNTWLGMAGPGVEPIGVTGAFFSDHTDIRPTMISLTGLTDDYVHDGRVLIEIMKDGADSSGLAAAPGHFRAARQHVQGDQCAVGDARHENLAERYRRDCWQRRRLYRVPGAAQGFHQPAEHDCRTYEPNVGSVRVRRGAVQRYRRASARNLGTKLVAFGPVISACLMTRSGASICPIFNKPVACGWPANPPEET